MEKELHCPADETFSQTCSCTASYWCGKNHPSKGSRQAYCSKDAASTLLDGALCLMPFNTIPLRLMYKTEDWNLRKRKGLGMPNAPQTVVRFTTSGEKAFKCSLLQNFTYLPVISSQYNFQWFWPIQVNLFWDSVAGDFSSLIVEVKHFLSLP